MSEFNHQRPEELMKRLGGDGFDVLLPSQA
jgi:hypothetical protein